LCVSNCALIFTNCGSTSTPKLIFINCWSLINIYPTIYNSYVLFLLEFHPLQHSLINDYSTFLGTPYLPELLLVHMSCQLSFFYAMYPKIQL
jgi:hypothetical protein